MPRYLDTVHVWAFGVPMVIVVAGVGWLVVSSRMRSAGVSCLATEARSPVSRATQPGDCTAGSQVSNAKMACMGTRCHVSILHDGLVTARESA